MKYRPTNDLVSSAIHARKVYELHKMKYFCAVRYGFLKLTPMALKIGRLSEERNTGIR